MRRLWMILFLLASLSPAFAGDAIHGHVIKVLPLFLDQKGHDAVSPSLFDRDAYQLYLRQHTNDISTIRFDVWWKAVKSESANLKLRVEMHGINGGLPTRSTLEQNVTAARLGNWTRLPMTAADYHKLGSLMAWRVSLWDGEKMLNDQKSFLW